MIVIIQKLSEKIEYPCVCGGKGGITGNGKRNVGSPSGNSVLVVLTAPHGCGPSTLDSGAKPNPKHVDRHCPSDREYCCLIAKAHPILSLNIGYARDFLWDRLKNCFFLLRNVKSSHLIANIDAKLLIEVIAFGIISALLIVCGTY